jgi:hypothetical protein
MLAPRGFDHAFTTKSNSTRSIAIRAPVKSSLVFGRDCLCVFIHLRVMTQLSRRSRHDVMFLQEHLLQSPPAQM